MLGKKKRSAGQGATAAKQMGLFVAPEEMMKGLDNIDDPELEAELAAITGNIGSAGKTPRQKASMPLPMADIAKMADECMRDEYEDDDDDLEDEDLLAALQEEVGEETEDAVAESSESDPPISGPQQQAGALQRTLEERVSMYTLTLQGVQGDAARARRYERGLKTLQTLLSAARRGRHVDQDQIPPPLALPAAPGPSPPHAAAAGTPPAEASDDTKALLLERQREYKMAALTAKRQGDVDQARMYFRTSKTLDAMLAALQSGQEVDVGGLVPPPTPGGGGGNISTVKETPYAPAHSVLGALEQRRAWYMEASKHAQASGDQRKARMHERIAKQYYSAIQSHKAGQQVTLGFPPIPGQDGTQAQQGLAAVLEAANQLASTASMDTAEEDELTLREEATPPLAPTPQKKKPTLAVPPAPPAAALQQKEVQSAHSTRPVDLSQQVPSPPGDQEGDFILVCHSDVQRCQQAEQLYTQLAALLGEQIEKCRTYSKQFTHLGNISETTKFEKMAEECQHSLDVLKRCQDNGLEPPKHRFEERMFQTVRIFPELSSTEMIVEIVRGINLPAPSGVQPNGLDAYVKFDFPYPSAEQPQKHKTAVIKNTNCPEYNQAFTLSINRSHRGFRRLVQSKGLKLEVLHKGGFLRSDKPVGVALVKLDQLERHSEVREIVEVLDGRKTTGGRVEVKVRLREPLSGQDHQTICERWLVLDVLQVLM